jgi:hypothetical protein
LFNCSTCGRYGATLIDKAFLKFLEPRFESLGAFPRDYANSGHFILTPLGKHLLYKFENIKHGFNGREGGDIDLPRRGADPGADEEGEGVLCLTA